MNRINGPSTVILISAFRTHALNINACISFYVPHTVAFSSGVHTFTWASIQNVMEGEKGRNPQTIMYTCVLAGPKGWRGAPLPAALGGRLGPGGGASSRSHRASFTWTPTTPSASVLQRDFRNSLLCSGAWFPPAWFCLKFKGGLQPSLFVRTLPKIRVSQYR